MKGIGTAYLVTAAVRRSQGGGLGTCGSPYITEQIDTRNSNQTRKRNMETSLYLQMI
jgi:hypothetical protein